MAISPALNMFLFRELRGNRLFNSKNTTSPIVVQSWMSDLAAVSTRVDEFADILHIASSLPLPSTTKERQQALELATMLLPTRALWPPRPAPQEQPTAKHEAYWKEVEAFFASLLAQPDIDPLAVVSHHGVKSRVEVRKTPLALVMMHAGHTQLLESATITLPQAFRLEAIEACARFNQIHLAERLLQEWDKNDPSGRVKAEEAVWMGASLRYLASPGVLPSFDPPASWWSRCLASDQVAAADRVISERPQLSWCLTNAYLQSGKMDHLLAIRMRGGLPARQCWVSPAGVELPAIGLMACAYVAHSRDRILEKHSAREWALRLNLVRDMLPDNAKKTPAHQAWEVLARWLYAAGDNSSHEASCSPVIPVDHSAIAQVQQAASAYRPAALCDQGQPDMHLLSPLVYALRAAATHDSQGNPDRALMLYREAVVPWLRELAIARRGIAKPTQGQAVVYSAAAEMLAAWQPVQLDKQKGHASAREAGSDSVELEVLMWQAAFQRLGAKGSHASFPAAMGVARPTWDAIRDHLDAGVCPSWDQSTAQVLHELVMHDPKLPDDIRAFIQAQALRQDRVFAVSKGRRI